MQYFNPRDKRDVKAMLIFNEQVHKKVPKAKNIDTLPESKNINNKLNLSFWSKAKWARFSLL